MSDRELLDLMRAISDDERAATSRLLATMPELAELLTIERARAGGEDATASDAACATTPGVMSQSAR